MYILGVLSAVLSQIYSYYFGSSAGSAEKNRGLWPECKANNSLWEHNKSRFSSETGLAF